MRISGIMESHEERAIPYYDRSVGSRNREHTLICSYVHATGWFFDNSAYLDRCIPATDAIHTSSYDDSSSDKNPLICIIDHRCEIEERIMQA